MSEYWELRDAQSMVEYIEDALETSKLINQSYEDSCKYVESEIEKIFKRFQNKHNLTTEEATYIINELNGKMNIPSLKRVLQGSKLDKAKMKLAEIEAPAYAARMKRFDKLQTNVDEMMKKVYKTENSITTGHYRKLAKESYLKSMFESQKRTGKGFGVSVNDKMVDKVIKSHWSGQSFSSRIWNNTEALSKDVQGILMEGLLTGQSSNKLALKIQEKYRTGMFESKRLVVTETAYIANEMKYQSMLDRGVKEYRFNAVLDKKTSSVCKGLDGKKFKVKDKKTGINYPPMHPFCRSVATDVLPGYETDDQERISRNQLSDKNEYVPIDMNYREWEEKYVTKNTLRSENYATDENGVKIKVLNEEHKTKGLEYEVVKVFDESGNVLLTKSGNYDSVEFNSEELKLLNNAIVTHNHPMGTTLSPDDVYMAIVHNIQEIRAVGNNNVYLIRRNEAFSKMPSYDYFYDEYGKLLSEYLRIYRAKHPNYKEDSNRYQRVIQENAMKHITDKYGLYYRKRKL